MLLARRTASVGGVLLMVLSLIGVACSGLYGKEFKVPGASMEPALMDGQTAYYRETNTFQRGDVALFILPGDPTARGIDRVVGLPGETVQVKGGQVLINGKPLAEPYLKQPATYDTISALIPIDAYFLLGDNRATQVDSHVFGPVSRLLLQGAVSHPKL